MKKIEEVQDTGLGKYAEWLEHRIKPLNKAALVKYILKYNGYAATRDVHVKPTKGLSSGSHGRLYELLIKLALGNYKFAGVAAAGQYDTRKVINGKTCHIEIKSGAGELIALGALNEITADIRRADYVIYSPQYTPVITDDCDAAIKNAVKQSYIMPALEFFTMLVDNDLTRLKRSTQTYGEAFFGDPQYDRITIQSFENSRKKTDLLYTLLEKNAMPLQDWLQQVGIWE